MFLSWEIKDCVSSVPGTKGQVVDIYRLGGSTVKRRPEPGAIVPHNYFPMTKILTSKVLAKGQQTAEGGWRWTMAELRIGLSPP